MTDAQTDVWLAAQVGSAASNALVESYSLELIGPFDPVVFRATLNEVVNRHEALRAVFGPDGGAMIVAPAVTVDVPVADLSNQDASSTPEEDRPPFDLTAGPLVRVRVAKLADDRHRVSLSAHTIVCDRWSLGVLVEELAAAYTARVRGSAAELPPAPSFAAYARAEAGRIEGEAGRRALEYWRQRFAQTPPPLELPTGRLRPARRSFAGGSASLPLGEELTTATREAAAAHGVTPDVWLLAALQALLHRLTGQTDVVVGTPTSGQTRFGEPRLVGQCVTLLPIRVTVEPDHRFRDLVEAVQRTAHDAAEHCAFPYARFRSLGRENGGQVPKLSVTFTLDPVIGELTFGDATARVSRNPPRFVNFDLQVNIANTGSGYLVTFAYDADLFDQAAVERWIGHYRTLLASAAADPKTAVGRLTLLTPTEFEQVVTTFNATAADYPRDACAHELVAESARITPDRVAVESRGQKLTYAELDARANRLARHLRELGVGPDVPVGVCLRRSADLVAALLAVWKAGGAYVPLDPDFPPARLKLYLEDSAAPVVLTQSDLRDRLPDAASARVVDLDADRDAIDARPASAVESRVSPTNLAYMIYTSGSTGTPNGVPVEHRALVNFLTSMRREPGLTEEDVVASVTTISFDIHHLELWLPLTTGARVAVLTREVAADGVRLTEELERLGATVLQATPATWRLLLAAGWPGRKGLKAMCGGEPMPPEMAAQLLGKVGELWNMYGPTETTVWSTVHRVESATGAIPIGKPIANTQVYVLDKSLQPVPVGCVGEVYIGGDGLARGYRNRPELTAARFVANPFRAGGRVYKTGDLGRWRADGVLECLGRIDHQVKVNGHRIELGDVEAALAKHPTVVAAAARVWGEPPQLVAYIVSRGEQPTPESIRHHLRDRLPGYMVPGLFTFVETLPLTPNGKVDRRALPDPAPSAPERTLTPARTDAERSVLGVWTEVFGRAEFGVTDDFFELGGTSLQAGEIVALVRKRLGHTIPLGAMYTATTVEKLAALLQHRLEGETPGALVPLQTGGSRPPLFMIAGIGGHVFTFHKFARILGPDYPVYGLKAIGVDDGRKPPESFEEIAAEYVKEITAARPEGPYLLSGYSIGAHVAIEVALQLQALGHEVPLLIVFDMPAPGYPPRLSVPRRLALHARNLFRRDGGGVQYAVRRVRNLGNRVLRLLGLEKWLFPHHPSLNALPQEALRDVWVSMQRAGRKYRPRGRLDGTVTLFRSEIPLDVWNAVVHTDPHLGWQWYATGPIEVQPVSRGHLDMFQDDNIESLARRVAEMIDNTADGRDQNPEHIPRAAAVAPVY